MEELILKQIGKVGSDRWDYKLYVNGIVDDNGENSSFAMGQKREVLLIKASVQKRFDHWTIWYSKQPFLNHNKDDLIGIEDIANDPTGQKYDILIRKNMRGDTHHRSMYKESFIER